MSDADVRRAAEEMIDVRGATWDGATAPELAAALGVPRLELRAEVESTQDIAHALAERGAPHGTVVLADAQRSGRGRMGRSWTSAPGQGVWCTLVLRPTDLRAVDVLSIRLGLFIAEALDHLSGEPLRLKWPNDLLRHGRKIGGILAEARWSGAALSWIAVGVGLNVRTPDIPQAAGLPEGVMRHDVLVAIVQAARRAGDAVGWLTGDELNRYRTRDALMGRHVVEPGAGEVAGISDSGALLVRGSSGIQEYRAGTIRFAEES